MLLAELWGRTCRWKDWKQWTWDLLIVVFEPQSLIPKNGSKIPLQHQRWNRRLSAVGGGFPRIHMKRNLVVRAAADRWQSWVGCFFFQTVRDRHTWKSAAVKKWSCGKVAQNGQTKQHWNYQLIGIGWQGLEKFSTFSHLLNKVRLELHVENLQRGCINDLFNESAFQSCDNLTD